MSVNIESAATRANADAPINLRRGSPAGLSCVVPVPPGSELICAPVLSQPASFSLAESSPRVTPLRDGAERAMRNLFALADVEFGGGRPWDITVHDPRLYARVLAEGSLGLGEAYVEGWWDAPALDEFFFHALRARLDERAAFSWRMTCDLWKAKLFNLQTRRASRRVARRHYDLGNDFYQAMLDPWMQYTCGYFQDGDDLARAQERKLDLICRKLQLAPGDAVLDLGCGFGGFAKFAAQRYGCTVTGVNISEEQVDFAREFCKGLPVEIRQHDYRDTTGTYDKIASIGMAEHVGEKNYRTFLGTARRCLKDNGIFLLHTIGKGAWTEPADPWMEKYIFPGAMIPSLTHLGKATDSLFVLEDLHNFGASYDPTVMAWRKNFRAGWPAFKERFGDGFGRLWEYYLSSCAGSFRARTSQLWQLVLTPKGKLGGYAAVR